MIDAFLVFRRSGFHEGGLLYGFVRCYFSGRGFAGRGFGGAWGGLGANGQDFRDPDGREVLAMPLLAAIMLAALLLEDDELRSADLGDDLARDCRSLDDRRSPLDLIPGRDHEHVREGDGLSGTSFELLDLDRVVGGHSIL